MLPVTLLTSLPSVSSSTGLLEKGNHIIYSVTGTIGSKKVQGAVGIKVVAVRENEFVVEVMPKAVPFMNWARLTFPGNGSDLSDLGGIIAGWSVLHDGERIGKEVIPTPFGNREVEHFIRIEQLDNGTLKTDQFVDPESHLTLASRMSGKSGEVLFGIIESDLKWLRSGK